MIHHIRLFQLPTFAAKYERDEPNIKAMTKLGLFSIKQ